MATHKCRLGPLLSSFITLSNSREFLWIWCFVLNSFSIVFARSSEALPMSWDHVVDLNEDYRVLWTIIKEDITFEVQARALGYVGVGFSTNGSSAGADVAIGWVTGGHTYFQDRYVNGFGDIEPHVDPSQDYILIMGYENVTHTVIRFQRKLDTCDREHDIAIDNNTIHLVYMYSDEDPLQGLENVGALPNYTDAWRPHRPITITQKPLLKGDRNGHVRTIELRNRNVDLPYGDDTLVWCTSFKLGKFYKKHHLIRYEPIYDSSWSIYYLQQMTLYECAGGESELDKETKLSGRQCASPHAVLSMCSEIVAAWTRGSEGFEFPSETAFPLSPNETKYFMLETRYNNNAQPKFDEFLSRGLSDSSGLKIYITPILRRYDAGVLSAGTSANWRHIIPPAQKRVISEGQCIEDCTRRAFSESGINIFAVMMRTHQIGREMRLRQIRGSEELPIIARDGNIDPNYQEFRQLKNSINVLPGDRLVTECIYDSSARMAITLGGFSMKEESCTVLMLYYPRQKRLVSCRSLPSLPTVLHSLGVEQLDMNSNPIFISSPPDLAGMTLETRLLSYDWKNQFAEFQNATLKGSFKPICLDARGTMLFMTDHLIGYPVNITKTHQDKNSCVPRRMFTSETVPQMEPPPFPEVQNNHLVKSGARNSRSSLSETLALSGADPANRFLTYSLVFWKVMCICVSATVFW